jgi:hypothetical protein
MLYLSCCKLQSLAGNLGLDSGNLKDNGCARNERVQPQLKSWRARAGRQQPQREERGTQMCTPIGIGLPFGGDSKHSGFCSTEKTAHPIKTGGGLVRRAPSRGRCRLKKWKGRED